jgi:acetoin utilization deacetylase AcuC-like enzyme
MGFCLFNNIAIAAAHARRTSLAEKIAIVDIDVHHGNGTEAIVRGDDTTLFVSLHQWPAYPGTGGPDSSRGNICNIPLPMGTDERSWLNAFDQVAQPRIEAFAPELILVSCGFDTLASDPLADFKLTPDSYTAIGKRIAGMTQQPTVWCLEGGYDPEGGARAATALVNTLAERTVQMRRPPEPRQVA